MFSVSLKKDYFILFSGQLLVF